MATLSWRSWVTGYLCFSHYQKKSPNEDYSPTLITHNKNEILIGHYILLRKNTPFCHVDKQPSLLHVQQIFYLSTKRKTEKKKIKTYTVHFTTGKVCCLPRFFKMADLTSAMKAAMHRLWSDAVEVQPDSDWSIYCCVY